MPAVRKPNSLRIFSSECVFLIVPQVVDITNARDASMDGHSVVDSQQSCERA